MAPSRSHRLQRAALERSWHVFVDADAKAADAASSEHGAVDVRDEVRASWARSAQRLDPAIDHAPFAEDAPERWRQGRLARAFSHIADDLAQAAVDGDLIAAVTDAEGTIVWTAGGRTMRLRAEGVGFVPGGRWDEASVGTNALALALRSGTPSTVWSAEHFAPIVHDWVCYSAPIQHPSTGEVLGVLDLSTTWNRPTPLALPTVRTMARMMGLALQSEDEGRGMGPSPRRVAIPSLSLRTLGDSSVVLDGALLTVPPRAVELLAILAMEPAGLTLEELHDRLHGEHPVAAASTKSDLSHLRRAVGEVVANRPYRLAGAVWADHVEVLDAVGAGDVRRAIELYRGPMLPRSTSPAIEERRRMVEVAVRDVALAHGDVDDLVRLSATLRDDPYVQEVALDRLPVGDPRRALVAGRADWLD